VLYALLFLPALLAIVYVMSRRPRTLEEAAVVNPFETIDSLLTHIESAALEERDVTELERLADELERAAQQLGGFGGIELMPRGRAMRAHREVLSRADS
jgi:hypothetical protein